MTKLLLSVLLIAHSGACAAQSSDNASDAGADGGGSGSGSGSGSGGACIDPFSGEPIAPGGLIVSYSIATAATQPECDAARIETTCTANGLLPPPGGSPSCIAEPLPPPGMGYYLSDCQPGAHPGCVAGNDANPGTSPDAPRRTLAGLNLDTLPAGTHIVFARGGVWTDLYIRLQNTNVTTQAPLVFGSYAPSWGGTARPILHPSANALGLFEFGTYNNTSDDGGYTIRNLVLAGNGTENWGLWLREHVHDVTIENVEISGFAIGIHSQSGSGAGVHHLRVRGSTVLRNSGMGMLGSLNDSIIEDSIFAENNFSGSGFNHAIYLGGGGSHIVLRNNQFLNNSIVNGQCTGGNVTVHGIWDDVLAEGNLIQQTMAAGGCYGFSFNPGYLTAESMTHFVARGNTIVNLGNCGVCSSGVPGIVVEDNVIVQTNPQYHAAIVVGDSEVAAPDTLDGNGIVRNNTIYMTQATGGAGIKVDQARTGVQVVSNLVYLGAGVSNTTACFQHGATGNYTAFDHNLCYRASAGPWSNQFPTLAAAQTAGIDAHSMTSDPGFVTLPGATPWSCALSASSPAIDAGHPQLSSPVAFGYASRSAADIGACEY